jgi:hypothetical protein
VITDPAFRDKWRSGNHVGVNKPTVVVKIQRGLLDRAYAPLDTDDEFGEISSNKHNSAPWHAFWRPTGGWITLPNVQSVETDIEFQPASGMADPETATVVVDNIIYQQAVGVAGSYHQIQRGWMSPMRGWTNMGSRTVDPAATTNEWFDVFTGGYRIRIWEGYGDTLVPVFTGVFDDTDVTDTPDTITLTCRSFGEVLTDSRVFGSNKAKELRSPIIFHDRLKADNLKPVGAGAKASTEVSDHKAANVVKPGEDTFWFSHAHTTPDNTEWVQVRLPAGRYNQFYVSPGYDEMEMFLSFYVRDQAKNKKSTIDDVDVNEGWVHRGLGDVPGVNGGYPYVYHWPSVSKGGMKRKLPFELECGGDTVMRVAFRKLGKHAKDDYRGRCARLAAYKATRKKSAGKQKWILVDDASDCVKWALMWAGFRTWNVVKTGVRLKGKVTFDQSQFLSDIVKLFVEQGDFVFFIERFNDADDLDIGVPQFVKSNAITGPPPIMEEIRDTDLLKDIETKFTKENLSYIIRVRGKIASKKEGTTGLPLGGDATKRIMATYLPPWSGAHHDVVTGEYSDNYPFPGRLAGIIKHVVAYDNMVESYNEAMMKCLLIAMQQALVSLAGSIEIPGNPGLSPNEKVSLVDSTAGVNTQFWITGRRNVFTTGSDAEFSTTLNGCLVDSPDLFLVALDYLYFLAKVQEDNAE